MAGDAWRNGFWWRWVVANGLAEFLGLGTVAALGFLIVKRFGEPHGASQALAFAAVFVLLGAFEGLIVGLAQDRVLRRRLPELRGWVGASVVGAIAAWALGMAPSTLMSIGEPPASGPPPALRAPVRLLLAAGLGCAAGPLLAFFQWRRLRAYVPRRAVWWLPANAAAWSVGMPVIFAGAHLGATTASPVLVALGVGLSLLAAGAVVGAVHGRVLLWMLAGRAASGAAA
jgi:hypothetical protein